MAYADITESFAGGSPGAHITTSNTAFPRIDEGTNGGAMFATGGYSGQCAIAQVPGSPTTQDAGGSFYDTDFTDSTSTIAAVDWTVRTKFKMTDSTSTPDTGWLIVAVDLGEVGKTPANWATGATDSVSVRYDAGTKNLKLVGDHTRTISLTAVLGQWLDVVLTGTNGSVHVDFTTGGGGSFTTEDFAVGANLYRARTQVENYRAPNNVFHWEVDDVYFGATVNDPFRALTPFCETFEDGTAAAEVTTSNSSFYRTDASVTFTSSSFSGSLAATSSDGTGDLYVYNLSGVKGFGDDEVQTFEGMLRLASGGSSQSDILLMRTGVVDSTDSSHTNLGGPELALYTDGSLGGSDNIRLAWAHGTWPSGTSGTDSFELSYNTWYHVIMSFDDAAGAFDLVVKDETDTTTVYSRLAEPCMDNSQYINSFLFFAWNGSDTTWDNVGVNCASFGSSNTAHCGTKVARYQVTSSTGLPYTVSPNGPNNSIHHGKFAIPSSRTVSFMSSLASDNDQDFYVQPQARFLTWTGTSFSTLSVSNMGAAVHLVGDATWETITRIIDAPPGATHWALDFAVAGDFSGGAPLIGTVLYLDCVYVVENGMDLAGEPYLDGDQRDTARGDGVWEGTPHDATSIWGVAEPPDDTNPPDEGGGGDSGGTDPVDEPSVDTPPPTEPIPPVVVPREECPAADIVTRRHPNNSFCPSCADGDIQLGDHLFNTVDEFGTFWSINDIDGWWNLPDPDIPDITRGIDDGSYETRGRYSSRIFTVTGTFWPDNPSQVRASRDRLIRAANLCHYGAWFATHEPDATRASKVWLSGRPSLATVNDGGRTDFSIGLKAPDPIKYGLFNRILPGWNSVALKSSTSTADFGRVYDRVYQWAYPTVPSGGVLADTATVTNDGNVRVSPLITVYGPTLGPINIHNITTNQTMRVRLGLGSDDILLIDCQNRTVSLNGVPNKRLYLDTVTDWIYCDPGADRFNYTEETGSSTSFITVQWRSGWIG